MKLGSEGILDAVHLMGNSDMGNWGGGAAFDVFSTIGLDQALGLDQLEGIVGNFDPEQIQQLGGDLGDLLGNLDFQGNGEVLQDFSFGTLGVLSPAEFEALGGQQLADLANTTGGEGIVGLETDQILNIVGNVQAGAFGDFDPSVVGGLFAGLDHDQIGGFDDETMGAALEAAGANLLGGLGDFDSIASAGTAFDHLAELSEVLDAPTQPDAFNIFSGNLFGSN